MRNEGGLIRASQPVRYATACDPGSGGKADRHAGAVEMTPQSSEANRTSVQDSHFFSREWNALGGAHGRWAHCLPPGTRLLLGQGNAPLDAQRLRNSGGEGRGGGGQRRDRGTREDRGNRLII